MSADHLPDRPLRFAALIEGATLDEVRRAVRSAEHVLAGARGPVIVEETAVVAALGERAGITTYEVTHFLDTGELLCVIGRGDDVAMFGMPEVARAAGLPVAGDVDGETEPRAIVRKLGLPESYLFP